jgi:hypothetical protein
MRLTQAERVLDALRVAGAVGITQRDFHTPTIDGAAPITRLAARVEELRKAGHRIEGAGKRHRFEVYVLEEETTTFMPIHAADVTARRASVPMSSTSPYAVDV